MAPEPSAEGMADISGPRWEGATQLFQLLLQNGFRFGVFPWPLGLIAVFLVGWLGLTLFIGTFVSEPVAVTAQRLSSDTLRAGLAGLLAAILVVSDKGVEVLPVHKGVLADVAEALAPIILEGIKSRRTGIIAPPPTK